MEAQSSVGLKLRKAAGIVCANGGDRIDADFLCIAIGKL
jgi:hypothetical protein